MHVSDRTYMGREKGTLPDEIYRKYIDELLAVPDKVERVLQKERDIERLAKKFYKRNNVFFFFFGVDSAVSYEGSLKLKEISYINSFAPRLYLLNIGKHLFEETILSGDRND